MIEHTFLKPFGTPADIDKLCQEALEYGFLAVAVNPTEIERCRQLLDGSKVRICAAVAFPLGQNTSVVKAYEIEDALRRGAIEIDMVLNVRALQANDLHIVRRELAGLAHACRDAGALSKVILETCYLSDEQKRSACQIALESGVNFVKTSTGFGSGGATVADVKLMRAAVGDSLGIKASGGIRDLASALELIEAGANRLGTSSSVAIIEAFQAKENEHGA
jgi:deoxyribose-phosphate aldolase